MTAADDAAAGRAVRARSAFAEIGATALRSNLARLSELDQLWPAATAGRLSEEERTHAASVAHQLVGSAGTFGYVGVSQLARRIEDFLAAPDLAPEAATAGSRYLEQIREQLLADPDDSEDDER